MLNGARHPRPGRHRERADPYTPRHIDSAYYVNFVFQAEPEHVTKLQNKFKLDPVVFLQHYQKLTPKTASKEAVS